MKSEVDDFMMIRDLLQDRRIGEAIHSIAELLTDDNHFLTIPSYNSDLRDTIYLYEGGIYKSNGRNFIRKVIETELGSYAKLPLINEVVAKVSRMTMTDRDRFENVDKDLICLKNGIFNLKTRELIKHSPSIPFLTRLNVSYKKTAKCRMIISFLEDILDKEDIDLIQEWIGFILLGEYRYKKALIIEGKPNTGKTTLLNVICEMIGLPNISNVSLQDMAMHRFSTFNMYGKYLNVYDDLSSSDVQTTGKFKMVTGRSSLQAERKFQDPIPFTNNAKMMFACNKIPSIKEDDIGYYSRWLYISCENVIQKKNSHLVEELTTPENLSGLLNWALIGLDRLETKGEFTFNKTAEEVKMMMLSSGNPVFNFIQERCEVVADGKVNTSKVDMYEEYVKYCHNLGLPICSKDRFGRQFPKYCPVESGKAGANSEIRVWRSVRLKGF